MKRNLIVMILVAVLLLPLMGLQPAEALAYEQPRPLPALTGVKPLDIANIAISQLGYMENPVDMSNYFGHWYNSINHSGVNYTTQPWCAMFACWCMDQAGIAYGQGYDKDSCSTASWVSWFKKNAFYDDSFTATPQAGDMVFFGTYHGSIQHVAVVVDYEPQTRTITFVGGNQQVGTGENDPWGVTKESIKWQKNTRRQRKEQYIQGIGRANYSMNPSCRHLFDPWMVVVQPGCETKGDEARSCPLCGEIEVRRINALGHDDASVTTLPTCTRDGYTVYTCRRCLRSCTDDIVSAPGHSGEWTIRKEPTLLEEGLWECDCSVCGEFVQEVMEKLPLPYRDIQKDMWYETAVRYAYAKGLMNGMSETAFSPDETASRAMLVTILWRLEGSPVTEQTHCFADLSQDWYMDAVNWAFEGGIVTGLTETIFAPGAPITRQQMAAMLYRYCQLKGYDVAVAGDLTAFPDAHKLHNYALEPMVWAVGAKLINGVAQPGGTALLEPGANATRAPMATILMRLCEYIDR